MNKIWVKIILDGQIVNSVAVPGSYENPFEALEIAMKELDLSNPLWLSKNQHEWETFRQTYFFPEDFLDSVNFDRVEIEFINPEHISRKSTDIRNAY